MTKQNLTISLSKSLLKRAKQLAVSKDISLSEFIREAMKKKIREDMGYKKAKKRQLRHLKTGLNLGTNGRLQISREELHARR
ncbi:CopG family transcriptional regulator [bacterium]|nr:CopG family transcriptional regulator [bacterium]